MRQERPERQNRTRNRQNCRTASLNLRSRAAGQHARIGRAAGNKASVNLPQRGARKQDTSSRQANRVDGGWTHTTGEGGSRCPRCRWCSPSSPAGPRTPRHSFSPAESSAEHREQQNTLIKNEGVQGPSLYWYVYIPITWCLVNEATNRDNQEQMNGISVSSVSGDLLVLLMAGKAGQLAS